MSQTNHRRRNTSVGLILAAAALAAVAFVTPGSAGADPDGSKGPGGSVVGGTAYPVDNTPYGPNDGQCDERGWHIIMNQIEPSGVTSADFGNVILQFDDGTTGTATFNKITPGGVASWYYMPAANTAPQTVLSASTTFPGGTSVASYGRFNISSPACYATGPTTTVTQPVITVPTTSPVIAVPQVQVIPGQVIPGQVIPGQPGQTIVRSLPAFTG